ncbi:DUF2608 domain-containing protein [Pyruvatibacter mobilis]|uniref:DUF2608 domain-containing protein n=1 Tax=Pyruvatibacter mobilis TaxID=1712261 RepID=UPI003C7CA10D
MSIRTVVLMLTVLCSSTAIAGVADAKERLTVMTFNVGNLFDWIDDPNVPNGRGGETVGRTEQSVRAHAQNVARVVGRADHQNGPDILVFTEVESDAALGALQDALRDEGLEYASTYFEDSEVNRDGVKPDQRGIDIAILSKLPKHADQSDPIIHPINLEPIQVCRRRSSGDVVYTRDIVEGSFLLPDNTTLTVLGVHFPSGGNDVACRKEALQTAKAVAQTKSHSTIIVGDFNFNCGEDEQAALDDVLNGWHLPSARTNRCRGHGSHYFHKNKSWSWLDLVTQANDRTQAWQIDSATFRPVLTAQEQFFWDRSQKVLRPSSFRDNNGRGVSDHFPVMIDLVKQEPNERADLAPSITLPSACRYTPKEVTGTVQRRTSSLAAAKELALELAESRSPSEVLVVFDIDNTLLTSAQDFGSVPWFDWQDQIRKKSECVAYAVPNKQIYNIVRLGYASGDMVETESTTDELIDELANVNGFPVMALTARGPDNRDATMRELEEDGLVFPTAPSCKGDGGWLCQGERIISGKELETRAAGNQQLEMGSYRNLSFNDGVMMVTGMNKGVMLRLLLDEIKEDISAVVFVDDGPKNIIHIQDAFANDSAVEVRPMLYTRFDEANAAYLSDTDRLENSIAQWHMMSDAICAITGSGC